MPTRAADADQTVVKGLRLRRLLLNLAIPGALAPLWANDLFQFAGEGLPTRIGEATLLTILGGLVVLSNIRWARRERDIELGRLRLAHLVDRIPLATVAIDRNARVVTWNPSAERLFGWKAEELIGGANPIVPARLQASSDALFARIQAGEALSGVEVVRTARSGELVDVAVYSAPLGGGETLILYDDIRERKRLERERDDAEGRYRALIESLPLVTYIDHVDDDATNVYTSPQIVDLLGGSSEDWAVGSQLFPELLHPEDTDRIMAAVSTANRTREPFDEEYRLRHRDGHWVWVHDRSTIIDGAEPFARGFLIDITEQKKLEEQLLQVQKMDALGQLAGGIAHDFNNLLTAIGGYAELASSTTEPGSAADRCLTGIRTASNEAASLTARLLAFSRRDVPARSAVDLNDIVTEATDLLERIVRSDVRVELALQHGLSPVAADRAQLKQVVLNLALNARDAMPEGGTISIETTTVGNDVVLRVRDTGTGMDSATRSRALEPFFTTKAEGEGTGLGLSVAYGVVDGLGGRLSLDSAPGSGTTVEISLPQATGELEARAVSSADTTQSPTGAERVLVVEDREVVRNLTRDVLRSAGFAVTALAEGGDALASLAAGETFDVVLTDVVMPEMSGPELVRALRAHHSSLPVVYMSGYTDDVLESAELDKDGTAFLRKPFGNEELIAAVRGVLDTTSSGT